MALVLGVRMNIVSILFWAFLAFLAWKFAIPMLRGR